MNHQLLSRLWELAEKIDPRRKGIHAFSLFGLTLQRPLKTWQYWATPMNSIAFACTGGDGVHFNLLLIEDIVTEASPVVLTNPSEPDHPNLIVGENLFDFLCLGCKFGYDDLEDIIYSPDQFLHNLSDVSNLTREEWYPETEKHWKEYRQKQIRLLEILRKEFALVPWHDAKHHFEQLQKQYLPMLQLRPADQGR